MVELTARLREETRSRHDRVEQALGILRDDLTRLEHQDLLARLYGFYQPWEAAAAATLDGIPDTMFARRRKAGWLERDLVHLGLSPTRIAELPRCGALPDLSSASRALGSAYVLEGATLGGQLISAHLERVLALRDGAGYSFYRSYGRETGAMWRSFQDVLRRHVAEAEHAAAVDAARETFDALYVWTCERHA